MEAPGVHQDAIYTRRKGVSVSPVMVALLAGNAEVVSVSCCRAVRTRTSSTTMV